ncbi:hypothetical protein GCM10022247_68990 [Allokutzneria multivorans]|uniref:Gram-positive cocci surface proteins LPxTG domain-containing protein n=1 Tax=Allokutzneria multivorans TaxID=1142134 RepID=A0ABP7U103_9PSEU
MRRLALIVLLVLGLAPVAHAANGEKTVSANGRTLTVAPAHDLDPAGQAIKVTGRGYDDGTESRRAQGIYLALCVDNGPGKAPSPCVGGVDMTGGAGSSVWISNNPPDYGKDLVKPYGPGGSFSFTITVKRKDEFADCAILTCAVFTRSDHTASGDRTQDVGVPVAWSGGGGGPGPGDPGGVTKHKLKTSVPANGLAGLAASDDIYFSSARADAVSVISGGTNEIIGTPIKLGNTTSQLALRGKLLYAVNRDAIGGKPTVSVVDTESRTVLATVPVGLGPNGVAVDQKRGTVFVTSGLGNSVTVIDAQHKVVATVPVGLEPDGVAVDSDSGNAYVANASGNSVSVIGAADNKVTATIPIAGEPRSVAIADGKAYVAGRISGAVSTVDIKSGKVAGQPIGVGVAPTRITAHGGLLYVSQAEIGQVSVIADGKVVERVDIGKPGPVVVGRNGLVYVANTKDNRVDVLTRSVSPKITAQPQSQTVEPGTATLTATAIGTPKPQSLWQHSIDGGESWADLGAGTTSGQGEAVTSTLRLPARNGHYRVAFSNEAGQTASASAVLTIRTPTTTTPTTTTQPTTTTVPTTVSSTSVETTTQQQEEQPPQQVQQQRLANTGADGIVPLTVLGAALLLLGGLLLRPRASR